MATPFETLKGCVPTPDSGETQTKELPMQKNTDQMTLSLISIAQGATTKRVRDLAVLKLWDIHGPKTMGISGMHSYQEDADWDLRGTTPTVRQERIMSNTFEMFRRAVMNYDTSRKVPFMAYVSTNSRFQQKTVKRNNAKHTNREIPVDFSGTFSKEKYGDNPQTIRDLTILNKADRTICQEIEDVEIRDSFEGIGRFLGENHPKLLQFWNTCYEVCQETGSYTDTAVADMLGYTRANIGPLRDKFLSVITEAGLDEDLRLVLRSLAEIANSRDERSTIYLSSAA